MNYRDENNHIVGYVEFKGEEYKVLVIDIDEQGLYQFSDVLFAFGHSETSGDLDALKTDLERFYCDNDTIGRIEAKYIFYDD